MKLIVDEQVKKIIEQMADICLKQGGLANLNVINIILSTMKIEDNNDENKQK